jgi:hypothetical protein
MKMFGMSRRLGTAALWAFLAFSSTAATRHQSSGVTDWSGQYELRVCATQECINDPTTGALRTLLVDIEPQPIALNDLSPGARLILRISTTDRRPPTGCWVLRDSSKGRHTYAGLGGVGIFHWDTSARGDSVYFVAGGSTDVFYEIGGVVRNGEFHGLGESQGSGTHGWPLDSVVGRRVGPPDASFCLKQARLAASDERRHVDSVERGSP